MLTAKALIRRTEHRYRAYVLLTWGLTAAALAGSPDYDAISDRDGNITTEQQGMALLRVLQDSTQLEALYADAAKGTPRAKRIFQELEESYFPDTGREMADIISRPPCTLPVIRELSGWCTLNWEFLDFLSKEQPGGIRLRQALIKGFTERARERQLENQLILSAVNAVLGVSLAATTLREAEAVASAQVALPARNAIDPNKLHHVFDKSRHALEDLVRAYGGQEAAFLRIQEAANVALRRGQLSVGRDGILLRGSGVNIIDVDGFKVRLIGGRVVDGSVEIGTVSREGVP